MGTTWKLDLFASPEHSNEELRRSVEEELERLVGQMSHWRADSDLSRFNSSPAGQWIKLPSELFSVLAASLTVAEETGGAFDATVGPLADAWGFGPLRTGAATPPPPATIEQANQRRSAGRVVLDYSGSRVFQPGAVAFDLSSIGKGFAVDRIAELLDVPGISSCLVEIGGELRARGVKSDTSPWWVSIENPPDATTLHETVVALWGHSIASSGDYRRYFEYDHRCYSHTIDPRTGYPVENAIALVTVINEQCMLADAYSTAIVVLGPEEGLLFADQRDLAALLIVRKTNGHQVRWSKKFREMLDD